MKTSVKLIMVLLLVGIVALVLSAAILIYRFALPASLVTAAHSDNMIVSSASWAKSFDNLQTMTADSDLVVRGIVIGTQGVRLDGAPNLSPRIGQLGLAPGVVFSDYAFRVEQVLKGHASKDSTIVVAQTGGEYNGRTYYIDGDPLFQVGERAILFLHDISGDPVQAPGEQKYMINGTPQARYRITNGQIIPVFVEDRFASQFRGMREEDFIRAIQAAAAAP